MPAASQAAPKLFLQVSVMPETGKYFHWITNRALRELAFNERLLKVEKRKLPRAGSRTDMFSLGVVVYEMLTGRLPFTGGSTSDVIASILRTEPQPPDDFNQDIPTELSRIVAKTLEKDREERYQTAKDLLVDLKHLIKQREVQTEIERAGTLERKSKPGQAITTDDDTSAVTLPIAAAQTGVASDIHTTSNAEYIVGEIKRHRLGAMLALATLLLAIGGLAYFSYFAQSSKAVIDSLAVLPFKNMTNDPNAEYLSLTASARV